MSTYTLKKPIENGTEKITELVIPDSLQAGHLRGVSLEMSKMDDMLILAENVTKQPRSVIDRLDFSDWIAISQILGERVGEVQSHPTM